MVVVVVVVTVVYKWSVRIKYDRRSFEEDKDEEMSGVFTQM